MENNNLHILVVDDDDRIRSLLKDYLSTNKYFVSTAENADEAKTKIRYFKFDIIILDVMMPGQSGYDLTKEIKKSLDVPIILLTAKSEVENRILGLELGADDYIGKPFTGDDLPPKVVYTSRSHEWSTTKLKDLITKQTIKQNPDIIKK